jgi:hypothetical protein
MVWPQLPRIRLALIGFTAESFTLSMTPGSAEENPYQSPKAEIISSEMAEIKRPGSTKAVLWLFGLVPLLQSKLYYDAIRQHGFEEVWAEQSFWDPSLYMLPAFLLCLVACRQRVTYWAVSTILFGAIFTATDNALGTWSMQSVDHERLVIQAVAVLLILKLFHRFTFGLPSRRYYGMIRDESPASETRSSET